jgi:hypothetical protein
MNLRHETISSASIRASKPLEENPTDEQTVTLRRLFLRNILLYSRQKPVRAAMALDRAIHVAKTADTRFAERPLVA